MPSPIMQSARPKPNGPVSSPRVIYYALALLHHHAVMIRCSVRTTIDLPDDLHKQALAIARDTHRTLSETVADLLRRGLGAGSTAAISRDPRTGLPLVSVGTVVTSEDVRSLEDEA